MTPAELADLGGMVYVPLSVVSLESPTTPVPQPGRLPMLSFTAPPYCWLDVGTPVHLHIERAPRFFTGPCACPRNQNQREPLAMRGWIVEEKVRTDKEVVYVVKNEESRAPVQHVLILFGSRLGVPPPPNAMNGERHAAAWAEDGLRRTRPEDGNTGPRETLNSEACGGLERKGPGVEVRSVWRGREVAWRTWMERPGMERSEGPGPMTMNLEQIRDPLRDCASASQPYAMWETYGSAGMSREAKAEEDAIRNYGCPIRIRPSRRTEGAGA